MTRMTGPDCAVMCNLINIHTHILKIGGRIRADGTLLVHTVLVY